MRSDGIAVDDYFDFDVSRIVDTTPFYMPVGLFVESAVADAFGRFGGLGRCLLYTSDAADE